MLASKKDHRNGCTSIQNSETIKPAKSHQLLMCPRVSSNSCVLGSSEDLPGERRWRSLRRGGLLCRRLRGGCWTNAERRLRLLRHLLVQPL